VSESIGSSGKGMKLHTKILLGLLIGGTIGVIVNLTLGGTHPSVVTINKYIAGPVGQIFLRLLFMIVLPLVFASISLGVAGLSATLGLIIVSIVNPGLGLSADVRTRLLETYATDASAKVEAAASGNFGIQTLVNIIPMNPVRAAVELDLLAVIFFGLIFGAALTMIAPERARPMLAWLEALNDIVIKIVEIAMKLAPYGVLALIFGVTSRFGFDLLVPLASYVATVLGSLLLHVVLTLSLILWFVIRISPLKFFGRVRSALVTAFSTSSSSATLPTALAVAEQNLGIPKHIAGFVLPLGSTMCMNGTALFEGITVIFLAQVFGVDLSLGQMVVVMIMSVLTAVGAAGVPGGSIPLLVGILAMFRVPPEGIAIILGVDRILDMSRTTVNVCGDLTATAYVAKSEKVWNASMVPSLEQGVGEGRVDDSPGWPPPAVPQSTSDERR
jgi:DAACS family dicarboxylate/amino acid:cation (Na+ or H+) symporter